MGHNSLAALKELALKEARLVARRPREALMPLAFSAVLGLAVSPFAGNIDAALAGLIGVQLFLAYYTVLQGLVREQVEGSLEGLRLSPVDPLIPLLAKTFATTVFIALGGAAYTATLTLLSSPSPANPVGLIAWTLALAPGLASISGLTASMLAYTTEPGILAAHITTVLAAPLYLATVEAGLRAAAGDTTVVLAVLAASTATAVLASAFARAALE